MKRNEIILRQDRIVYILLVVTAVVGLTWVLWRHQYLLSHDRPGGSSPMSQAPR